MQRTDKQGEASECRTRTRERDETAMQAVVKSVDRLGGAEPRMFRAVLCCVGTRDLE